MRLLFPQTKGHFITLILVSLLLLSSAFLSVVFLSPVEGATSNPQPMKEKTFYLHTLNETRNVGPIATQYIMDSIVGDSGYSITSNMRIIARWFLFPELAGFLYLEGNVTLVLWYKANGTLGGATWVLTLNEIDEDGNINLVKTVEKKLPSDPMVLTETSITASLNYTLQPGSTLEAHINIKGDSSSYYTITWDNSTYKSLLIYYPLEAGNYTIQNTTIQDNSLITDRIEIKIQESLIGKPFCFSQSSVYYFTCICLVFFELVTPEQ